MDTHLRSADFLGQVVCAQIASLFAKSNWSTNNETWWAVVVAQLAERSLLTPEVSGLNPVMSKILFRPFVYFSLLKR